MGANAMIFGRGGGGGVLNRVTKQAGAQPIRELTLQAGGYQNKRFTTDLGEPLGDQAAVRLNAMVESSDSFRSGVNLERYAVNPTLTFLPAARTRVFLGYEFLYDGRLAFAVEGPAGNVIGLAQNLRRLGIESPVPKKRYDRGHERLPLTAQAHPATFLRAMPLDDLNVPRRRFSISISPARSVSQGPLPLALRARACAALPARSSACT